MKFFLLSLCLFIGITNIAEAKSPSVDFLSQKLLLPYPGPMSGAVEPQATSVTVGTFISNLKEGEWESDEKGAWIYRIKIADKLTERSSEVALMLMPGFGGVVLERAAIRGKEIPRGEIAVAFLDVLSKSAESKQNEQLSSQKAKLFPNFPNKINTKLGTLEVVEGGEVHLNGGRLLKDESTLLSPAIAWVYPTDSPATLMAIFFNTGGTACPGMFRIIDLSKSQPSFTEPFGTCTDLPDFKYSNGILVIAMGQYNDGLSGEWIYKNGILTEKK